MSLVGDIFSVALEVGKYVAEAIARGDDEAWRPIADIMPAPLKSRLEMVAQKAKTQAVLEKVLNP